MSDIFISYHNEDRPGAQMLAQALGGCGWSIFWDRKIPIGKTWPETIGRELDDARCVVVLWSKTSIKSDWVREEAEHAKQRGVLVPVLIDNVLPPIGFRTIQAADLVGWDTTNPTESFRSLISDIGGLIGRPPKEPEDGGKPAETEVMINKEAQRRIAEREPKRKAQKDRREIKLRTQTELRSKSLEEAEAGREPKERRQSYSYRILVFGVVLVFSGIIATGAIYLLQSTLRSPEVSSKSHPLISVVGDTVDENIRSLLGKDKRAVVSYLGESDHDSVFPPTNYQKYTATYMIYRRYGIDVMLEDSRVRSIFFYRAGKDGHYVGYQRNVIRGISPGMSRQEIESKVGTPNDIGGGTCDTCYVYTTYGLLITPLSVSINYNSASVSDMNAIADSIIIH
jgi:hypothetical protein